MQLSVEMIQMHGGVGYTYILETFIGMLEAEGVSTSEIDRICRVNPGEMLAFG